MHRTKELIIILILIGFFAYLPSLFGNFVWDDEDFVYANTYVKNFQIQKFWTENAIAGRGKTSNYYRPIQFTLYSLIYKIAGPNPSAFHAVGIMLHIIAAIMVITVITVITNNTTIGFLTALFFLIHPLQTESVSYISGLSDPLYVIFFLLSLFYFLKRNERMLYKVLGVGFFILSLLSKELALILPGIIILLVIFVRHPDQAKRVKGSLDGVYPAGGRTRDDKKTLRNDIWFIGLFILIALLYLISRFTFLKFSDINLAWAGNPYGEHFIIRLATFFRTFFTSLELLMFPKTLFMERDFTVPIQYSLLNLWTFLFIFLNGLILIFLYKKSNDQCPNPNNQSLFFYLCFLASLIPYTGIFLLNGIYYEHYLYLPMIFFWAALFSFFGKYINHKWVKIFLFIIIILFFIRSYVRQYEWIDNERFYRQTLSFAPKSVRMLNGLGMTVADKSNCKEAIRVYEKAIQIDKTIPNLYHNIANCHISLGNNNEAEKYYLQALKINPKFVFSYTALMNLYGQTNQKKKLERLKEIYYPLQ